MFQIQIPKFKHNERSALNIEIGHVSWSEPGGEASARESLLIANEWIANKRLSRAQISITMLVDDKDHGRRANAVRGEWLVATARRMPEIFSVVDWVCFESDLQGLAPKLVALLVESNRSRRAREFQRYQNKHGLVACSHDVAIWHAFRLGLLEDDHPGIALWSRPSQSNLPSFFASEIGSVLEEGDRGAEVRAREILGELSDGSLLSAIKTIYYAV